MLIGLFILQEREKSWLFSFFVGWCFSLRRRRRNSFLRSLSSSRRWSFLRRQRHLSIPKSLNIDSDRKRKKDSVSSTDQPLEEKPKDKRADHHHIKHCNKKSKMASRDQVKASHILTKHQGSRRKASWKDPEGKIIMTTTREAAVEQLKSIREDIVSGKATFEDVAARVSDCSSAKRGGDLGLFCLLQSLV